MTTDEHGNRLPTSEPRLLPQGAVLACGDSFAAGAEVIDSESWPALLETRIRVPVINAACGGWGADQIVMRAEEMLELAQPRALIVSFFLDDMRRAEFGAWGSARKPYYVLHDDVLKLCGVPVPLLHFGRGGALFRHCYVAFLIGRRLGYLKWDENPPRTMPQGTGVEISRRLLERLKALADRQRVRMLFLMQYGGFSYDALTADEAELHRQAAEIVAHARRAGIETIDTWDRTSALYDQNRASFSELFVMHADGSFGHMSKVGNQLIADMAAESLLGDALPKRPCDHQGDGPGEK